MSELNDERTRDQRAETIQDSRSTTFFRSMDLFAFLPVPKSELVSSKTSGLGTLVMLSVFVLYMIFNFIQFVVNNAPRVNEFQTNIGNQTITLPDIAFQFFYGEPFIKTVNDKSILSFSMSQTTKFQDLSKHDTSQSIDLVACNPDWIPNYGLPFLCPKNKTFMNGALYQTKEFIFPRIQVDLCKPSDNQTCVSDQAITEITQGGRIILFVRNQGPNLDLTTGEIEYAVPYKVFQFFLIPGLYLRSQISFELSHFSIYPDYFSRWTQVEEQFLSIEGVKDWTTNVSLYNNKRALQLYFTVNQDKRKVTLVYATLLDQISKWGAFWGVLFGLFSIYFLKHNRRRFYDRNGSWDHFETSVGIQGSHHHKREIELTSTSRSHD